MSKVYFLLMVIAISLMASACSSKDVTPVEEVVTVTDVATQPETAMESTAEPETTEELSAEETASETVIDESGLEEYIFPYSDVSIIRPNELGEKTAAEYRLGRNEIYARHGRKFSSADLQEYFNSKSWYSGTIEPNNFSENVLSKVEIDNIKALKFLEDIPELPPTDGAKEYLYYMTVYSTGEMICYKQGEGNIITVFPSSGDTLPVKEIFIDHNANPPVTYEYDAVMIKQESGYLKMGDNIETITTWFDDAKMICGGNIGDSYDIYKRIK